MRRLPFLALCLTLAASAMSGQRNPLYEGTVVSVLSGDTIRVKVLPDHDHTNGQEVNVRLWGIDPPPTGRRFAKEAKARLSTLALGQKVQVNGGEVRLYLPSKWDQKSYYTEVSGKDGPYPVIVLNDEMVASGLAIPAKPTGALGFVEREKHLQQELESAKKAKRGMWVE